MVAIFSEQESQAVYFLKTQNISRLDIVNFITHGVGKDGEEQGGQEEFTGEAEGGEEAAEKRPLDAYATNLNVEAEAGKIDPLIGRLREVDVADGVRDDAPRAPNLSIRHGLVLGAQRLPHLDLAARVIFARAAAQGGRSAAPNASGGAPSGDMSRTAPVAA